MSIVLAYLAVAIPATAIVLSAVMSNGGDAEPDTPGRFQLRDCPRDGRSCLLRAYLGADEGRCDTHGTVIRP